MPRIRSETVSGDTEKDIDHDKKKFKAIEPDDISTDFELRHTESDNDSESESEE